MTIRRSRSLLRSGLGLVLVLLDGCASEPLIVPSAEQVAGYYTSSAISDVQMSGNVAEIHVRQEAAQLRRGGSLWARVGPYIYLFTAPTQQVFLDFNGLAGVRVITEVGTAEVARALLTRDALNDLTWRRALNINGLARRDGTARPVLMEDLIRWGEDYTEFRYSSRFIR